MDSHTNFDPAGFGRSSAILVGAAASAIGTGVASALANAQALADFRATETTMQEWSDTVVALRDALIAQIAENHELKREVVTLAAEQCRAASKIRLLEAENVALAALA